MTLSNILAVTSILMPLLVSLLAFAFWLSNKIARLESSQESNKTDLMNYIKLYFNDERINLEKKFDSIELLVNQLKEGLQSNRHSINNMEMRVKHLEEKQ